MIWYELDGDSKCAKANGSRSQTTKHPFWHGRKSGRRSKGVMKHWTCV